MAAPDVSIIIAAYECSAFIGRAIKSVLAQQQVDLEVLIINDGSTDDLDATLAPLLHGDPRFTLIDLPRNGGPSVARNAGFRAARGEWLAILDADDALEPGRLARLVSIGRTAGADIVADNFCYYDARTETQGAPGLTLSPARQIIDRYGFVAGARPYTSEADFGLLKPLFRRSFIEANQLAYPPEVRHGEDFVLYINALLRGAKFVLTREPGYLYTTRASGLSRTIVDYEGQLQQVELLKQRPEIAADSRLLALLDARAGALRRLATEREFQAIVSSRNKAAMVAFAFGGSRNANLAARWFGRALLRKSRGGTAQPQKGSSPSW